MKTLKIILIILLSVNLPSWGQADSIINALRVSGKSKPEMIRIGTEQALDRLSDRDIAGTKQIIDYLLTQVEDSAYAAFDSFNYALILYWMHDYEGLIDFYLSFDSLRTARENKVKPRNLDLYMNLAWSLPEVAGRWFKSISASGLNEEYQEVLILDLHKWAEEVDAGDYMIKNYSKRLDRFKKKYPQSRLIGFVEKYVKPGHFQWEKMD